MKIYNSYTSKEKADYKLELYLQKICSELGIECTKAISSTIIEVFECIKELHGTKRLKIKDGIILVCIGKLINKDHMTLAKMIGIENKYIYNTQKLFAEIPKLRQFIYSTSPFEYVEGIYRKNQNALSHYNPLEKTKKLIEFCEKNNILTEKSPMTIGVACLFNILSVDYDIDIVKFSETYSLSTVTILKANKQINDYLES